MEDNKMEMFCKECTEKLEIKKQLQKVKTELDNCEFSLATGVWKHNVNVNLVRAKEELDRLIKHRAIKE